MRFGSSPIHTAALICGEMELNISTGSGSDRPKTQSGLSGSEFKLSGGSSRYVNTGVAQGGW
jgi:hypothetical protein